MSGILEEMQKDISELRASIESMRSTSSGAASPVIHTPGAAAPDDELGLASNGVDLIPKDPRIHSNAKVPKTVAGLWKRKKGISDSLIATVEAELKVSQSTAAVVNMTPGAAAPGTAPGAAAPGAAAPGAAAPGAAAPGAAAPGTAPGAAAPGTAPGAAAPAHDWRKSAIGLIQSLTNEMSVTAEDVHEVITELGFKTFDSIPVEQHEMLCGIYSNWYDKLKLVRQCIESITAKGGVTAAQGIEALCLVYGVKTVQEVNHTDLPVLFVELSALESQWVEYLSANPNYVAP